MDLRECSIVPGEKGVVISVGRADDIRPVKMLVSELIAKHLNNRLLVRIFVHADLFKDKLRSVRFNMRDGHGDSVNPRLMSLLSRKLSHSAKGARRGMMRLRFLRLKGRNIWKRANS